MRLLEILPLPSPEAPVPSKMKVLGFYLYSDRRFQFLPGLGVHYSTLLYLRGVSEDAITRSLTSSLVPALEVANAGSPFNIRVYMESSLLVGAPLRLFYSAV